MVFSYREGEGGARELAEEVGGVAVRADQRDLSTIDALLESVGPRLDILVNNAAINSVVPLAAVTAEEFDRGSRTRWTGHHREHHLPRSDRYRPSPHQ
ncbi:hypothetical protein NRB20_32620 [Nocardia sp. RB20]|uniref:Uncharacterized protein n=1 Tax=Nocardia macrotermitis TaxID=2585198 RepID=A0A7K0D361_9NOCA|nr:hypothetical protein [Nocardia macrotermitis]